MRKTIVFTLLLALGISLFAWLSPFRYYQHREGMAIVKSIEVNASSEKLYAYLGNSGNASEWSSYVGRIEPLNEEWVADGAPGLTRRCFKKRDESVKWDERIEEANPYAYRRLSIFNLQNLSLQSDALMTEQVYEALVKDQTRLSLSLFLDKEKANFTDYLKMYMASFSVAAIFEANLKNIKDINENLSSPMQAAPQRQLRRNRDPDTTITLLKPTVLVMEKDSLEMEIEKERVGEEQFYTATDDLMWYHSRLVKKMDSLSVSIVYQPMETLEVCTSGPSYIIQPDSSFSIYTYFFFDGSTFSKRSVWDLLSPEEH